MCVCVFVFLVCELCLNCFVWIMLLMMVLIIFKWFGFGIRVSVICFVFRSTLMFIMVCVLRWYWMFLIRNDDLLFMIFVYIVFKGLLNMLCNMFKCFRCVMFRTTYFTFCFAECSMNVCKFGIKFFVFFNLNCFVEGNFFVRNIFNWFVVNNCLSVRFRFVVEVFRGSYSICFFNYCFFFLFVKWLYFMFIVL